MPKTYQLIVMSNAVEGGDREFNEWYDKVHLSDVLKVPGFVAARRLRMAAEMSGSPYRYCAIYELESDDPMESVRALMARAGTDQMPLSDKFDPRFHAAVYEDFGASLRRKRVV
jgi:hypothetical protein